MSDSTEPSAPRPDADSPAVPGYALGDEVGRGGMGVVFRARDLALDREVAVKLLQDRYEPGSGTARRFVDEARITAQLQHPGVPPVYHVGALADGRPFLAMKLIKGATLDQRLKADAPLDRLAVFEAVCQAVGYAHAHGVIHRDLKPANVMVGAFNDVQVMDWGLAKVLASGGAGPHRDTADPDATTAPTEIRTARDSDTPFTQYGSVLGTPAYMPPEQAAGETDKVDRRSDVFGLGAVLCATLTGRPPFDGADADEVRLNAVRGRTEAAFARLDACGAEPDVVALCKRCLAFEPAARPADAGAVAAEVAALRAAADERARRAEVEAGQAIVREAEGRKRRRLRATAGGLVLAVTLAGGAAAAVLWRQAVAEEGKTSAALGEKTTALGVAAERLADRDAARAKTLEALRTLTDEYVTDDYTRKRELTDRERAFLRKVLGLWQAVADTRGDDPAADRLRAEGSGRVALLYANLGEYPAAIAAFRASAAAWGRLADAPRLARARTSLGFCLRQNGQPDDAERVFRETVADLAREGDGGGAGERMALADARRNLGALLLDTGRLDQAEPHYRAAVADYAAIADAPDGRQLQRERAAAERELGNLLDQTGRADEADPLYRSALRTFEALAADPSGRRERYELARTRADAGRSWAGAGRHGKAEPVLLAARDDLRRLAADAPLDPTCAADLGDVYITLGCVAAQADRLPAAEDHYRSAVGTYQGLLARYPHDPYYASQLATAQINLGQSLARRGEVDAGVPLLTAAVRGRERLALSRPTDAVERDCLVRDQANVCEALAAAGRAAALVEEARSAARVWTRLTAARPDDRTIRAAAVRALMVIGNRLEGEEQPDEASAAYRAAARAGGRLAPTGPGPDADLIALGGVRCNLGNNARARGATDDALAWYDQAVGVLSAQHAADPKNATARQFLSNSHLGRARTLDQAGRHAAALPDWDKTIELSRATARPALRAERSYALARASLTERAIAEAAELLEPPAEWPAFQWYNFACVYALAADRLPDERDEYAARAVELLRKAAAAGYRNAHHLATDADLAAVRGRADFRAVLDSLRETAPTPRVPAVR